MSEQLWYTWSDSGFGMTSAGFRVRAASRGFVGARGFIDMQDERLQTLMKYLNYDLPLDTSKPLDVTPEQAPRSLLFIQAGKERILVNKVYTGLDGVGRPGAFFSHLLTDLPPVHSSCPDQQLPFSAREAIRLWRSNFWKESEQGVDPNQLVLPQVSPLEDLTLGSLSTHDIVQLTDYLLYVIQAFLTLPKLGEGKRLYIAAPPDTVATLIWGLTNVLPRTLQIMETLTFSTYERDLEEKMLLSRDGKRTAEKPLPRIIGTCWFSPSTQDLPSSYYEEQNSHGFALNCYKPDQKTPLTPDLQVSKFVQFAVQCFASRNMEKMNALLNEAEKRDITDLSDFLVLYPYFRESIPKDDLIHLLSGLHAKLQTSLNLQRKTILPEDDFRQWKSIISEIDALKRESVRNSIIRLLIDEPSWWQLQGKDLILQLQQLASSYSENNLSQLRDTFIHTFSSNMPKPKGLKPFSSGSRENDPSVLAKTFAEQVTNIICTTQDELTIALRLLATDFAKQVVQAISANDGSLMNFWHPILDTSIFPRIRVNIWTYLLQQLSTVHHTPAYKRWWSEHGSPNIQRMSTFAERDRGSQLDQACSDFIKHAAQELMGSIKSGEMEPMSFWQGVLSMVALYTSKPDAWLNLLISLCQAMDSSAYQQWWQMQGKEVARYLRKYAEMDPHGEIANKLSIYADDIANVLYTRIIDKSSNVSSDNYINFLLTIITTVTLTGDNNVWPDLLHKLSTAIHEPVAKVYGWELRSSLLKIWGNIATLEKNQYIRCDWLAVHWNELDKLLSLQLPADWPKVGIMQTLHATSDFTQIDDISVVKKHSLLFEEVLEELLKIPATQQTTLSFFALLAQHQYNRIFPLLDRLLAACKYQKEVAEKLLASLHLQSSRDVTNLLEHYCKTLLSKHELPPTLLSFIQRYLKEFDPDFLDTNPTRELLLRLLARKDQPDRELPPDLQNLCKGWYWIAEFIKSANVENIERDWLENLLDGTRKISSQLTSDVRRKLAAKLIPHLVEFILTEIDLGRVIDHLGRVLIESSQEGISRKLVLLEQMAKLAGEKYGQEHPPARIALYLKVALDECRFLPSAEKTSFVDRCLDALLKQVNTQTRDTLTFNLIPWWPKHIIAEWEAYLSRSSRAAIDEALTRFRSALQKREMFAIAQAYDPSLENYLQCQEREIWMVAHKFVTAYRANDDAALVKVNDIITQPPYHTLLTYTYEQQERVKQARDRISAALQQAAIIPNIQKLIPAQPHRSQPEKALANQEPFIAEVKGQIITQEQFNLAFELKYPYTEYRVSWLREQIWRLDANKQNKKILNLKKAQLKGLNKLLHNSQQLREATLDNLVNDVLIREAIHQLISEDSARKQWFDVDAELPKILEDMRVQHGYNCQQLLSKDRDVIKRVENILRIFRRYELFERYYYIYQNNPFLELQVWLKEQRKREAANISINYALAEVKAPTSLLQSVVNVIEGKADFRQ